MKNVTLPSLSTIEIKKPFERAVSSWNKRWERALQKFSDCLELERKYFEIKSSGSDTYQSRKVVGVLFPRREGSIYFLAPGENSFLNESLFVDEKSSLFLGSIRIVSNQPVTINNQEFIFKALPLERQFSVNFLEKNGSIA